MNLSVIGLGYVGLPTAALAATAGHTVCGYDTDLTLCAQLRTGFVRGCEDDVRALTAAAVANGSLRISDRVESADAYIVCVPTPADGDRPDLRYVEAALADIARVAREGELIVIESTVPPGTTERLVRQALRSADKAWVDIGVVHAPERILPGDILRELRENDRIVGGRTPHDAERGRALYASFVEATIHSTDLRTAEFVKVIENTYRDVNIALANELALYCEELDIDVWQAIRLANNHPRVNIMQPGPGVGGHCIPIDPRFLADQNPFATELIQASRRINERMPYLIVRRILGLVGESDGDCTIAILGAAYKANVDDTRESPALHIRDLLHDRGYRTTIYDPIATVANATATLEDAVRGADALVLAIDHDAFKSIDPRGLAPLMRQPILVDCRNFFTPQPWAAAGFSVYALGRGSRPADTPRLRTLREAPA
jgi:UDP-N-acetyl-D-mannosaminuronic acid dehydrogenase